MLLIQDFYIGSKRFHTCVKFEKKKNESKVVGKKVCILLFWGTVAQLLKPIWHPGVSKYPKNKQSVQFQALVNVNFDSVPLKSSK